MKFRPSTILKLQKYIIYTLFYVSEVKISLLLIKHKMCCKIILSIVRLYDKKTVEVLVLRLGDYEIKKKLVN